MTKPRYSSRVAIVGAGLSGLACADALMRLGHEVQLFDKGRGPGGRASTRRAEIGGVEVGFDHGAQYFTVRDQRVVERVHRWEAEGVASRWEGRIAVLGDFASIESYNETPRYVGVPGMNAICRHLACDQDIRCGVTVGRLERLTEGLAVLDLHGQSLGEFDMVVVTAPPIQTANLLAEPSPELAERAASVVMKPCWALMAAFEPGIEVPYDGAFVNRGPLSWIARASSKPERAPRPERWVLHASAAWSSEHLEETSEVVSSRLLGAFFDATGVAHREAIWVAAHRWRYALAENPLTEGSLLDASARIAVCGDWTHGNRVEGALLSGLCAARRVAEALARAVAGYS